MAREEKHAQVPDLEHGQRILCPCQGAYDLGMPDVGHLCQLQGFLVDGRGGQYVCLALKAQLCGFFNILIGRLSGHGLDFSDFEGVHVNVVKVDEV